VLHEQPVATVDPMSPAHREARNVLYDAKRSGNGTMSCASCHVDGDMDGLAWDLGDRYGLLAPQPSQPFPFNLGLAGNFHPMKGPMTTQTLRGLSGAGVLHWRGDRGNFQAFNGAFDSLMGGGQIPQSDMNDYAAFVLTMAHPPNPNQLLDRSLRTAPAGNNEAAGMTAFNQAVLNVPLVGTFSCSTCHSLPIGTSGLLFSAALLQEAQDMKVPQLRNMYRKVGAGRTPGAKKSGFGYTHDGALGTLSDFFALPVFNPWPSGTKDDIVTMLLSFDSGTAPAVGRQVNLTQGNASSGAFTSEMTLLTTRAAAGDLDLTAHGVIDGRTAGLLYDTGAGTFTADRAGDGPYTLAQLQQKALAGVASLAFTAAGPGSGHRLALDRDQDGTKDGDEAAVPYGTATPGCAGESRLLANSEPRLGNTRFGYVMDNAPANGVGLFALSLGELSAPVLGITLLIDPSVCVVLVVLSDTHGDATFGFPMLPTETVGQQFFAQAVWLDACGTEGFSSSKGLGITVRP
jgi:hypothetical protein